MNLIRIVLAATVAVSLAAIPTLADAKAKKPKAFCEKDGKPTKAKKKAACEKSGGVWKTPDAGGALQMDAAPVPVPALPATGPSAPPAQGKPAATGGLNL
jgi:hypothetical protein